MIDSRHDADRVLAGQGWELIGALGGAPARGPWGRLWSTSRRRDHASFVLVWASSAAVLVAGLWFGRDCLWPPPA